MNDPTGSDIVKQLVQDQGDLPPVLWHYTGQASFHSIVKNQSLWLSSYLKMNDELDSQWLCKLLEEDPTLPNAQMASFKPSEGICLASLSFDGNKQSQWEEYAEESNGIALKMDVRMLGFSRPEEQPSLEKFYWKVVYDREPQRAILDAIKKIIAPHLLLFSSPPRSQSQVHLAEQSRGRSNAYQHLWMGIRPYITISDVLVRIPHERRKMSGGSSEIVDLSLLPSTKA